MGADKVDLGLGDGSHADLVEGTGEECGKGAAEDDVPVPASKPNANANQILFRNEALDVAIGERLLVGEGEGGVLGVAVQSQDATVVSAELHQSITVGLAGGNLREHG